MIIYVYAGRERALRMRASGPGPWWALPWALPWALGPPLGPPPGPPLGPGGALRGSGPARALGPPLGPPGALRGSGPVGAPTNMYKKNTFPMSENIKYLNMNYF